MKKSAFTLIELLVVIAIIAVLASIALPVYGKVMERAKATNDANNLRQLGVGTVAYLNDNDDQIFTSSSATPWPVLLYSKYVTNWKTFVSPFDAKANVGTKSDGSDAYVSYGVNPNVLVPTNASPSFDGNVTRCTSPSQLLFMAPSIQQNPVMATIYFPSQVTSSPNGNTPVQLTVPGGFSQNYGTHANRNLIDALFMDAHVATIKYADFCDSTDTLGQYRWQPTYSN